MQIEYQIGDMFAGPEKILVHGCNAQGRMGSGVAKVVRDRFPAAYDAYAKVHRERGLRLGEVIWAICDDRIIGNAITQERYGYDGQRYVDYDAIRDAMREVNRFVQQVQSGDIDIDRIGPVVRVGFPLLGAGLGGGEWSVIAAIIEDKSDCFTPVVYRL